MKVLQISIQKKIFSEGLFEMVDVVNKYCIEVSI